MQVKLEFITECDAQHGAMYFDDRGHKVRLMGKALVVDKPGQEDPALVMETYRAFTVELNDGDLHGQDAGRV